jgi:hypothetical protein
MSTSAELAVNRKVLRETTLDKLTSRNVVNLPRTILARATTTTVALTAADSGRDILVNAAALTLDQDLILLLPAIGAGTRGLVYRIFYQVPSGAATRNVSIDAGDVGRMQGGIAVAAAIVAVNTVPRFINFIGAATHVGGSMVEFTSNGVNWSVRGQTPLAGHITATAALP